MNVNAGEKSNSESQNFETLKYNITDNTQYIFLDDSCDPGVNVFNVNFQNFDTPYLLPEKSHDFIDNTSSNYFSILHLNIMSIKKNIKILQLFLTSINFTFSVICFSETWLDDLTLSGNALYELPSYTSKDQVQGDYKGGGVSMYTHNSLILKIRPDLSISNEDIELNFAKLIETSSIKFERFFKRSDSIQLESPLSVNELKDAFFSLKINKRSGYDDISFNVARNCFGALLTPLMHVFNLSLEKMNLPR